MSLSKKIIFDSDKIVAKALKDEVELDVLDEYGYTPLIQTAIVDSVTKAELLLKAGAKVDFSDLTGRTALHWAASNNNFELCKLLLENGANPNAYTFTGQSVLVFPILRKNKEIQKLLFKYGANINFAQDFINAKLLGHRFELEGRVDIVDHQGTFLETEFEGFYLEFTLDLVTHSLIDFRNNFAGKYFRKYFSKVDVIINSLRNSIELLKFQNYLIDVEKHKKTIDKLLDYYPLILPIAFEGHAITMIKFWEWFVRCDRGEFGRKNGTVLMYYIRNQSRVSKSLFKQLLYKRQYIESLNEDLPRHLNLDAMWKLPVSEQRAGNCTWANVEAVIPAMMFLLLLEEQGGKNADACQKEALDFYDEWVEWDKNRALHFCLDDFAEASPARKASRVALMAAVMFQSCDYNDFKDKQKVAKMLPVLTLSQYDYVLKSYLKVFSVDKKNPRTKSLYNFLDNFGIKY